MFQTYYLLSSIHLKCTYIPSKESGKMSSLTASDHTIYTGASLMDHYDVLQGCCLPRNPWQLGEPLRKQTVLTWHSYLTGRYFDSHLSALPHLTAHFNSIQTYNATFTLEGEKKLHIEEFRLSANKDRTEVNLLYSVTQPEPNTAMWSRSWIIKIFFKETCIIDYVLWSLASKTFLVLSIQWHQYYQVLSLP